MTPPPTASTPPLTHFNPSSTLPAHPLHHRDLTSSHSNPLHTSLRFETLFFLAVITLCFCPQLFYRCDAGTVAGIGVVGCQVGHVSLVNPTGRRGR